MELPSQNNLEAWRAAVENAERAVRKAEMKLAKAPRDEKLQRRVEEKRAILKECKERLMKAEQAIEEAYRTGRLWRRTIG